MIPHELDLVVLVREIVHEEIATLVVQPQPKQEWFTVSEAADYLRVSSRTVERWIEHGDLRSTFVGRRIIKREWLDEFATTREEISPDTPPRRRERLDYALPDTPRGGSHAR